MDVAVAVGGAVGDIVDVIVAVRVDVAVPVGGLVAVPVVVGVAVRPVGVAAFVGVGVGATTPSMSICSKRGLKKGERDFSSAFHLRSCPDVVKEKLSPGRTRNHFEPPLLLIQ